ncbi:MAG: cytochrome C [Pelovirga sp.]
MKKRDMFLLAGAVALVAFLWAAPEETTAPVPRDDVHERFYDIVKSDGRKAAEAFCSECHNADAVPFTENHPSTFRCLFCHKMEK